MAGRARRVSDGPCQFCMSGSSLSRQRAQLVLLDGVWQPWPLVMARPDTPMILCEVCPVCERERFNTEEVPRLNYILYRRAVERTDRESA